MNERTPSGKTETPESVECPDCVWIGEGDERRLALYCMACENSVDNMIAWLAGAQA
jgi:hypothetical protein